MAAKRPATSGFFRPSKPAKRRTALFKPGPCHSRQSPLPAVAGTAGQRALSPRRSVNCEGKTKRKQHLHLPNIASQKVLAALLFERVPIPPTISGRTDKHQHKRGTHHGASSTLPKRKSNVSKPFTFVPSVPGSNPLLHRSESPDERKSKQTLVTVRLRPVVPSLLPGTSQDGTGRGSRIARGAPTFSRFVEMRFFETWSSGRGFPPAAGC